MKINVWILKGVFWSLMLTLKASNDPFYNQGNYNQGKNQARSAEHSLTPPSSEAVPGFQGTDLPEAQLTDHNIQPALNQTLHSKDHVSQVISKTHEERLRFHLDPQRDPVLNHADSVVTNPLEALKGTAHQTLALDEVTKTQHTCQEGGEAYSLTCTRTLHVQTIQKIKTYLYTRIQGVQFRRSGRHYGQIVAQTRGPRHVAHDQRYDYTQNTPLPEANINYFDGCNSYPHRVTNHYTYEKKWGDRPAVAITLQEFNSRVLTAADIEEFWTHDCDALEQKVDQGMCTLTQEFCSQGPATRLINDHQVSRPCWQKTLSYQCSYPVDQDCAALKSKGCVQIHSQCHHKIGHACVLYTQTYQCTDRKPGEQITQFKGDIPWCLDGHCTEPGDAPNQDMADSLSKLMIFKEMQKNVKDLSLFKGEAMSCDRLCLSFKDCCHKSGWGLGISGCTEQDKELGLRREKKQCVYVGTYCADKVLGQCVRKRSTSCCFSSKLARLIQEQGRLQLGLTFGEAEHPQCQGFTVDQLTRLDFEKIDLSSLLAELFQNLAPPNLSKLTQDLNADWNNKRPAHIQPDSAYLDKIKQSQGTPHAPVF